MTKVAVYAICKNESKHIQRWYDSIKDADAIFVVDTGSSDNSVELLKKLPNVTCVSYIQEKFNFANARNKALELIPKNFKICISLDLDECLSKDWKKELLKIWNKSVYYVKIPLVYGFEELSVFYPVRIHRNNCFEWIGPIHEVLIAKNNTLNSELLTDNFKIIHQKDNTKNRSFYLELLEDAVNNPSKNEPNWLIARNIFYLCREYYYNNMYDNVIATGFQYIHSEFYHFNEELAYIYRYMAHAYKSLGNLERAEIGLMTGLEISPCREIYTELGFIYTEKRDYNRLLINALRGLEIKEKRQNYFNEDFAWQGYLEDQLAFACYKLGINSLAVEFGNKAVLLNPAETRFNYNFSYYLKNSKQ